MSIINDQARIEEMRRRLYERGNANSSAPVRHSLTPISHTVESTWQGQTPIPDIDTPDISSVEIPPAQTTPVRSYRKMIMLGTIAAFFVVVLFSTLYLLFGNNEISNKNIAININAPLTVGGGEVTDFQIAVTNQNKIAIESAVLIVSYPAGTKSADEQGRDIFEERVSLNRVNAGETINVPLKAIMYGEENQEKQIKATIEFRLADSSGTFYKEADPINFKISSSPVVIRINSVKKVSAGQDVQIELTVQSNAPTPLRDILVSANYPNNFKFSSSEPNPAYRENTWLIKELLPAQSSKIVLKGAIAGKQAEEFQIQFSAGASKQDNQFEIGSILANAKADFEIEEPFIKVALGVNGSKNETVTMSAGREIQVEVTVENTLEDSLYDMAVEVGVSGNLLVRENVQVSKGFYDSVKDVIRFEPSGDNSLAAVPPGSARTFNFTIRPGDQKSTASFSLTANAFARRVGETSATEQIVGTAKSEVKFTSAVGIARVVARNVPGFVDVGSIPPAPDTETTYTITLEASAGGNDVTGGVVTTSLPQYVNWKNLSSGDGTFVFNPVSKELTWTVGDIKAGNKKKNTFQIGLLPSQNQIGTTPAVLGTVRFSATDRFTGDVVRSEAAPASTELGPESGLEENNGQVTRR